MRALTLLAPLPLLVACGDGPILAPADAVLTVPDNFEIAWKSAWNSAQDGSGIVLFGDILVEDSDGLPLERIQVEMLSSWGGVYLIPSEAVELVDPPEAPEDWETAREETCTDDEGNFELNEDWCAWYYDTVTGQFYEISSDYADAGGYSPNYLISQTDGRGLMRAFIYVDVLPTDADNEASFEDATVYVLLGATSGSFTVTTGQ